MAFIIDKVEKVTASTTAKDVEINNREFLISNNSANTVYIKEKAEDGKAVTSTNGFAVPAGKMIDKVLCAGKLSIVASAADTDVRILYGREM